MLEISDNLEISDKLNVCLRERDETFSNGKNVKIKIFIWQFEKVYVR